MAVRRPAVKFICDRDAASAKYNADGCSMSGYRKGLLSLFKGMGAGSDSHKAVRQVQTRNQEERTRQVFLAQRNICLGKCCTSCCVADYGQGVLSQVPFVHLLIVFLLI